MLVTIVRETVTPDIAGTALSKPGSSVEKFVALLNGLGVAVLLALPSVMDG
jgi:hypothetical protein